MPVELSSEYSPHFPVKIKAIVCREDDMEEEKMYTHYSCKFLPA